MNNKKLFEICCKETLMRIVQESEELNKKLTFFQKTLLYDKIKEMPLNEVISLLKEEESKASKTAQYGLAAYAGRKVGKRVFGGKPVTAFGQEIVKGATTKLKGVRKPQQLRAVGKFGVIKGGFRGALAGAGILFLFKKLSDPCVYKNIGNSQAQKVCKRNAAKKVLALMKKEMGQCTNKECRENMKAKINKAQDSFQKYF